MEARGFFVFVGYVGVNIPRRLDARSRDALVPSANISTASAACVVVWPRDDERASPQKRPPGSCYGGSSVADSRPLVSRRPLLRRAGAWSFLSDAFLLGFFACRPRRRRRPGASCGFGGLCFCKKRQSLSGQCSRCWVYASITIRTLSLHRTNARSTDRESACTISSRNRCAQRLHNSARDEGRATQRSNG